MGLRTKNQGAGSVAEEGDSCATRRAILDAARNRFLHYGYKKTTIDEIALDAGIGKGTVYLYFDNKEQILLTIVREVKRSITEQMSGIAGSLASPEEKIRRMILASIATVHEARSGAAHGIELVDELLQPKLMACGNQEREKQHALVAQVLREGMRQGIFSVPEDDAEMAAKHLMLATVSFYPPNMTTCHCDVTCRRSLESRVNAMLDFLFHGIRRQR